MQKHLIILLAVLALVLGISTQQIFLDQNQESYIFEDLVDSQGNRLSFRKKANQVRLINFWATWCPPCREEIPDFVRLQEEFKDQNFTVIGLAIDKEDKVRAFEQEMGINYPSLIVEKEGYTLMEEYGSTHGALPYTVILDKNGEIAYKHNTGILHYEEAKALIEPLL